MVGKSASRTDSSRGELANLARLQRRKWQSIAKENAICRERRNSWPWRKNALQIQRISSAERSYFVLW